MSQPEGPPWRLSAVKEVTVLWAAGFLAIVVSFLLFGGTGVPKLVATVGFLYLPLLAMRWRDEDFGDYGLTLRQWKKDLRLFLLLSLVVGPLFFAGFALFVQVVPNLPPGLARLLTPFVGEARFHFKLPPRFGEWVIDQLFVVALPEEFFYRGLHAVAAAGRVAGRAHLPGGEAGEGLLGDSAPLRPGAPGHLPGLAAGGLLPGAHLRLDARAHRQRGGAALFHAACNLYVHVLEVSFFG